MQVDMLQEINSAPRILTNYVTAMPISFKKELDSYLQSRMPANFLSELRGSLQVSCRMRYQFLILFNWLIPLLYSLRKLHAIVLWPTSAFLLYDFIDWNWLWNEVQCYSDELVSFVCGYTGDSVHSQQRHYTIHGFYLKMCPYGYLPTFVNWSWHRG